MSLVTASSFQMFQGSEKYPSTQVTSTALGTRILLASLMPFPRSWIFLMCSQPVTLEAEKAGKAYDDPRGQRCRRVLYPG